jgi:hypothetical protein
MASILDPPLPEYAPAPGAAPPPSFVNGARSMNACLIGGIAANPLVATYREKRTKEGARPNG